jgi:hypothetical protein
MEIMLSEYPSAAMSEVNSTPTATFTSAHYAARSEGEDDQIRMGNDRRVGHRSSIR